MSTGNTHFQKYYDRFESLIMPMYQKILDFPLYRENPMNLSFDDICAGSISRRKGIRYTNVTDDFYNAIFKFCTFVVVSKSGFDDVLEDNYSLINDSEGDWCSIQLYEKNQESYVGEPCKWMSTLNDQCIDLIKDTWKREGQIWFLSYWEKLKKDPRWSIICFHFFDNLNVKSIKNEILRTQLYVFKTILNNPEIIIGDDCLSWICCTPSPSLEELEEISKIVFEKHFRSKYEDLITDRMSIGIIHKVFSHD